MRVKQLRSLWLIWVGLLLAASVGCTVRQTASGRCSPLSEYGRHAAAERIVGPEGFIEHIKRRHYPRGEVDGLPRSAVVLFTARVEDALSRAAYRPDEWTRLEMGESVSKTLYVVRPKTGGGFLINRGLPGASGVTAQMSELVRWEWSGWCTSARADCWAAKCQWVQLRCCFTDSLLAFVEMEQAALFEAARRARVRAASLVRGSDR